MQFVYEGSTLSDGTYRNALNKEGGYQNEHQVYDRAGQPCPRCRRNEIIRIVQAQRSTFYCPKMPVVTVGRPSKAVPYSRSTAFPGRPFSRKALMKSIVK